MGRMNKQFEKKVQDSLVLLENFIKDADVPVLAFGAGRESCTIVALMHRYLTSKDFKKIRVVLSDVEAEGMAQAQAHLMHLLGFSQVEIGPGVAAVKEGFDIGTFPVVKQFKHESEKLLFRTNWGEALVKYEHIIIGMRKTDRPPRDQIVNYIGTEAFGYRLGMFKHVLFPLADWTSEDLDEYLAIGVENRMKVTV